MPSYSFFIREPLRELARHAIANHAHQRVAYTEEKPEKPALLLVKDSGCYLMSCFTTKDAPATARLRRIDEKAPNHGGALVVVYAEGAHPEDGHIGGDDFGEDLPGLPEMILKNPKGCVLVTLTDNEIKYQVL